MKNAFSFVIISVGLVILGLLISFIPIQTFPQNQSIENSLNLPIETLNGSRIDLSSFSGHNLIIDFFATWCVPCESQAQLLHRFKSENPSITIISISVDKADSITKLMDYKNKTGITWLIGRDIDLKANNLFGTYQLPTIAYIDPAGILIHLKHNIVTYSELESWANNINVKTATFYVFGNEISATLGLPLFFFVGLYVALSPCLFPIMPITILQVLKKQDDINNDQLDLEKSQIDNKTNNFNKQGKGKLFYWIFMLWSGILFSFGIFSLVGVFIGFLLIQYYLLLNFLFGIALIIFGIIILIPKLEEITFTGIKIPESIQKYLQKESYTGLDLFVIGTIYSIIALPCSGPIFIALIPIIINYSNPILSMLSLFVFAIGLLLPYVLLISITSKTQMQFVKGIRNRYILVKNITAILLLFMGGILAWPFFGGPILFSIG